MDLGQLAPQGVFVRLEPQQGLRNASGEPMVLVTDSADEHAAVGFDNLSNFNRQFRALKQATPREFRRKLAR